MAFEVKLSTKLPAPPDDVWRVLTSFSDYGSWHPHREIAGEPQLGSTVLLKSRGQSGTRRVIKARVSELDAPRVLTFSSGRWLTGRALETFALEPSGRGTLLHHSVVMPEFITYLLGGPARMRERLLGLYRNADEALGGRAGRPAPGRVRLTSRGR